MGDIQGKVSKSTAGGFQVDSQLEALGKLMSGMKLLPFKCRKIFLTLETKRNALSLRFFSFHGMGGECDGGKRGKLSEFLAGTAKAVRLWAGEDAPADK